MRFALVDIPKSLASFGRELQMVAGILHPDPEMCDWATKELEKANH